MLNMENGYHFSGNLLVKMWTTMRIVAKNNITAYKYTYYKLKILVNVRNRNRKKNEILHRI